MTQVQIFRLNQLLLKFCEWLNWAHQERSCFLDGNWVQRWHRFFDFDSRRKETQKSLLPWIMDEMKQKMWLHTVSVWRRAAGSRALGERTPLQVHAPDLWAAPWPSLRPSLPCPLYPSPYAEVQAAQVFRSAPHPELDNPVMQLLLSLKCN